MPRGKENKRKGEEKKLPLKAHKVPKIRKKGKVHAWARKTG